jgi:hypothetical protein
MQQNNIPGARKTNDTPTEVVGIVGGVVLKG